ncbi:MAG: hypothetical protein R8K21_04550 [Mariprofundales bacterium]
MKVAFWVILIGTITWVIYSILPVYNNYWKVQDTFESMTKHLSNKSELEIRNRMPDIFKVKYISIGELPPDFNKNLDVRSDGYRITISTSYDITVWLLGEPATVKAAREAAIESSFYYKVDAEREDPDILETIQHLARVDFHFEPTAETP